MVRFITLHERKTNTPKLFNIDGIYSCNSVQNTDENDSFSLITTTHHTFDVTKTVKLVYGLLTDNRKDKKTLSSERLKYFMQIVVSKSIDKRSLGRDMKECDKVQKMKLQVRRLNGFHTYFLLTYKIIKL